MFNFIEPASLVLGIAIGALAATFSAVVASHLCSGDSDA
jgi:hypothetical protein